MSNNGGPASVPPFPAEFVIGAVIVLALVVDEIAKHLNRNQGNNNGQQNTPNQ